MRTIAIIPAAGMGKRINSPLPKQFVRVNGKEIIAHTLSIFQNNKEISEIIVSTRPEFFDLLEDIKKNYGFNKLTRIVKGGKERQDSVFAALSASGANNDNLIAVHDAARPLLSQNLLSETIAAAKKYGAVVTAIKAKDTLIEGNDEVENYLDRNKVYYAQTPQIFKYEILFNSMKKAYEEKFTGTDESMLVKKYSGYVKIVEGETVNFKITTNSDLKLFEKIIQSD